MAKILCNQNSEPLNLLKWQFLQFKNPQNQFQVKSEWHGSKVFYYPQYSVWKLRKFFVKVMFLLKKVLNRWFDEIFFSMSKFLVFPHCDSNFLVNLHTVYSHSDFTWNWFWRNCLVRILSKKKLSDSKSWSKVDVFGVSTPNTVLVYFIRGAHPKNFKILNQTAPFLKSIHMHSYTCFLSLIFHVKLLDRLLLFFQEKNRWFPFFFHSKINDFRRFHKKLTVLDVFTNFTLEFGKYGLASKMRPIFEINTPGRILPWAVLGRQAVSFIDPWFTATQIFFVKLIYSKVF